MTHRLPASGISNPPVSLPLVNNETVLVHSNPPSKISKVRIESDSDVIGDSPPGGDKVPPTCKACGLAVDVVSAESYELGVDAFCNVTCKTIENSRVSARQMGPAVVALTKQNREQAKQIAQDLGARLGQLQSIAPMTMHLYPKGNGHQYVIIGLTCKVRNRWMSPLAGLARTLA